MSTESHKNAGKSGSMELLRSCELDTMAMVFIWEYFNEKCKQ